jgi:DNA mismatch repair protein MutS2
MPSLLHPAPPKTASDLEWPRVAEALAARSATPMGQRLARALPFGDSLAEVRSLLAEAEEAARLATDGRPLPIGSVPDVADAVDRLRVGGVLAPGELRAVAQMLLLARSLRRFLHARRESCPALFASCATDPTLDEAAEEVSSAFDPDGTLSDNASPRLRELRSEHQASRARMVTRLEDLMTRYAGILQDRFVTEREGRYVIPVRSDAHERFPGIVHATSASGSTLFVEPRAVIPMGNRLKMLDAEVAREEIAVYTRLSGVLSDVLPSIEACEAALARADVRAATARLAADLRLAFPRATDEPAMRLESARHPLLLLDLPFDQVVPSDLAVNGGHAMVVSGPNAGGKTVALKTMGLCALMVRAGLPIPADGASEVGVFQVVLTDVGDDQSLHKNLSTFSAHVKNLAAILEDAQPGALVLLDEIATGTDPREGEALAAGVLDSLCARGAAVAATTHYEGLKALALADPRFSNASVGFDLATMTPTFRLAIGVPGSSSALAVARRFGLPQTVIDRATRFLSREEQSFEELVKKLNDERAALDLARQAAERREREANEVRVRLDAELAQTKDRERRALSKETEELMASVRRAREELRAVQQKLRSKRLDEASAREAEKALDRVAREVAIGSDLDALVAKKGGEPRAEVRASDLRKGARVYVPRLRAEAEIVDVTPETVRVAAGAIKLTVPIAELRAPPGRASARPTYAAPSEAEARSRPFGPNPTGDREARRATERGGLEVPIQTSDNSVDLRGLRADDALSLATSFLDRSLNAGRKVAFLVHGHGTGALRDALRRDLRKSPYVAHFRAGEAHEGGDGTTVVWLA